MNTCSWREQRLLTLTLQARGVAPWEGLECREEGAGFPEHAWTLSTHVEQGSGPDPESLHTVKHHVQSSTPTQTLSLELSVNCSSSRRWHTQTQSSSQSDTAASAINHNRKSQGLVTSVSGVAVTLADWFSLRNWNCCVLFPPLSQTAPALVYSDHHLSAVRVHELYQTVGTLECQLTYWVSTTFTRLGFSSAHNAGRGRGMTERGSEGGRERGREAGAFVAGWKTKTFPSIFC